MLLMVKKMSIIRAIMMSISGREPPMETVKATAIEENWPSDNFTTEISRYKKGEPEALVRVFKRFEPDLNRYYWYCFGDADIVEEAMQEFYKLMVTRLLDPKYRNINISLYKIMRKDAARRIIRFLNRFAKISLDNPDYRPILDRPPHEIDIFTRIQLMDCLDQLKSRHRDIVTLHFLEGIPMTDIPQAFGDTGDNISYENVRQIVVRSLKALKKCLEEGGEGHA